ncbi:Nicotine blue oxidoreductase [Pseudovibrio axinellae]|uniref:Nicotine blue oxidoreductase n=1 Tax=Pseudovibrio axinellae TaxID=989403 RepID=A0A166A011_9HYPH|nr:molybdopterin-binding/glycosyltransferase family 2 protein [Pseudovibrio axinellae]KZL20475.1 Nicotine blue oxidoreductase [Pseudovibrio axinellae]SEQ37549.1 molybdopterin molybdochelatase /molybdenum cofactor cytidylyltransferase [Pseudovibrio axinellae]
MKFETRSVEKSVGCYLAHSIKDQGLSLSKGHELSEEDVRALLTAGFADLSVVQIESTDLHEDEAAELIAKHACGEAVVATPPFTGRANLYATHSGILQVNAEKVTQANLIDPAITLACLAPFSEVREGRMLATAKIIPLAVDQQLAQTAAGKISEAISVATYTPKTVAVISTRLPHLKETVISKSLRVLQERLDIASSTISADIRIQHDEATLATALQSPDANEADLIVVFGASAVVDPSDVIPAAIQAAGGDLIHFGMPVDPGNLLVLGDLKGTPVIGAPGCARSPQENGFDWILRRLLANVPVTRTDIMSMGVGGLLKEIHSRPQPRDHPLPKAGEHATYSGILLAAGNSSRMGDHNKLLAHIDGKPVVRQVAENALASELNEVVVVTGAMAPQIKDALSGLSVRFLHNENYNEGISSSVKVGIEAISEKASAALILLGDMPFVTPEDINNLLQARSPEQDQLIGVSTSQGKRGNPVLWDCSFFEDLLKLRGDIGGKPIIQQNPSVVYTVEVGRAARQDLDDPQALQSAGGVLGKHSEKP